MANQHSGMGQSGSGGNSSNQSSSGSGGGSTSGNGKDGSIGEKAEGVMNEARDRASDVADQAKSMGSGAVESAKEQAHELAPKAREMAYGAAESGREDAASALDRAADTIEERAVATDGMQSMAAEKAAGGMHAAAGYLQEHETAEILDDVEGYVRAHPMRSVSAAIAAGFIVGRILR